MDEKFYYEGSVNGAFLNRKNNRQIKIIFMPEFEKVSLSLINKWEEGNS